MLHFVHGSLVKSFVVRTWERRGNYWDISLKQAWGKYYAKERERERDGDAHIHTHTYTRMEKERNRRYRTANVNLDGPGERPPEISYLWSLPV